MNDKFIKNEILPIDRAANPIYIELCDGPCKPLGSHFFGQPAMPPDIPWPTHKLEDEEGDWIEPLDFVCQIEYKKGLLLFFADIAYYAGWDAEPSLGCNISDTDVVRVIYIPEKQLEGLVERDDAEPLAQPRNVRLLPDRPRIGEEEHQLFGEPGHREWEDWDSPFEGWRLLLQLDSCEGPDYNINFVDCGVLNFVIAPEDLKEDNFRNVRGIILST